MDAPPGIYNLGRGEPVKLLDFIRELEDALGKPAILNLLPAQPGEMAVTWAGGSLIQPRVSLREGVLRFAEWYLPWAA
jgi:UDP-glucuronate 4-epimerase